MTWQGSANRDAWLLNTLLVVTALAALGPPVVRLWARVPSRALALAAVGVLFIVLGTAGFVHVLRGGRWRVAYLGLQLGVVVSLLTLGRNFASVPITVIALAAQAGLLLAWRAAALFGLVLFVAFPLPYLAFGAPFGEVMLNTLGLSSGIFFGLLFAQLLRREQRMRAEIDELATARERNRLAREVHDALGATLTAVSVQLDAAQRLAASGSPGATEWIDKARTTTRRGLADLRATITAMRAAPWLGRPLEDAVGELATRANGDGLRVDFRVEGDAVELPPEKRLTVFRAAQEALTNVVKHGDRNPSGGSRAAMRLTYGPENVRLRVANPASAGTNGVAEPGFGLLGLRERAGLLNGRLSAVAHDGEFVLELEIPR